METIQDNERKLSSEVVPLLNVTSIFHSLNKLWELFPNRLVFSTSFSLEDQVILHSISETSLPIQIFTLDTGRLFPETYSTWERSLQRYSLKINAYFPETDILQDFIDKNGPNSFYNHMELRKQCCNIRKVIPLKKALAGSKVWISGLRAAHSSEREGLPIFEWDEDQKIFKYYPLLHWEEASLKNFIHSNGIPYNILSDKGFSSIGCQPCTRAIQPGEALRAGRWWWENEDQKECGLHINNHNKGI